MSHGYIVLTQDLDFSAILAASQSTFPSVLQIRSKNEDPMQIGAEVIAALKASEQELKRGAVLTIDPKRTRVRILPFRAIE